MANIEGLGNDLSGVLHSANAGIEGIQATQPDRESVMAQLGAMMTVATTLEGNVDGLSTTVRGLRQSILAGRLEIFEAGSALSGATEDTENPVLKQAIREYDQAAGDDSAGSNLNALYDYMGEHQIDRILTAVGELVSALNFAMGTARKHRGNANDMVMLTGRANDNVRLYALEAGIPLSE